MRAATVLSTSHLHLPVDPRRPKAEAHTSSETPRKRSLSHVLLGWRALSGPLVAHVVAHGVPECQALPAREAAARYQAPLAPAFGATADLRF